MAARSSSPVWVAVRLLLVCCSLVAVVVGQTVVVGYPSLSQQVQAASGRRIPVSAVIGYNGVYNGNVVGNLIDSSVSTGWQPVLPASQQCPVEFQFDVLGQQAYLITGFSIVVNPSYSITTPNIPTLIGLVNGTGRTLLDAVETYTVGTSQTYGTATQWASNTDPLGTQYFQVTNPFVTNMLTVVYYAPYGAEILVFDTKFYGQPILQASNVQDVTGLPSGSTCQPLQVVIDGVGKSQYCPPLVYYNERYNLQLQLNLNPAASYSVTGFMFKSPPGNNYPTQVTWWAPNQSTRVSPIYINTNLAPGTNGYQLITLPTPVTMNGGWVTVGFQTSWEVPIVYQVQVVGSPLTALTDPGTLSVLYNPNCPYRRSVETQQFYQRYNAPFAVATNTLPLDSTSWTAINAWWGSQVFNLWHVPPCFAYPLLPSSPFEVAGNFTSKQLQQGQAPGQGHYWLSSAGLIDAFGEGCPGCSRPVSAMYNELTAMNRLYTDLQLNLNSYFSTYLDALLGPSHGYQASISLVGTTFEVSGQKYIADRFNFLQGEIDQLAAASSSHLALATSLLSLFGSVIPGVGLVWDAAATVTGLVGTAIATGAALITTTGAIMADPTLTASTAGVVLSSPFDSLLNSGWAVAPTFSPTTSGCTGTGCITLTLQHLSENMGWILGNATSSLPKLTPQLLSNYGYFRIFNAWYQAYQQPGQTSTLYPKDILKTLTDSAAAAQPVFQAVVAYRMLTNIFQLKFYNLSRGNGFYLSPYADPTLTILALPSNSPYPSWDDSAWNATRSVFSNWNSSLFLGMTPKTYSDCPTLSWHCRDTYYQSTSTLFPSDYSQHTIIHTHTHYAAVGMCLTCRLPVLCRSGSVCGADPSQSGIDCGCNGGPTVAYYKGLNNATVATMLNAVIPPPFVAGADALFSKATATGAYNGAAVQGTPAGVTSTQSPPPPCHAAVCPGGP